MSEQTFDMT